MNLFARADGGTWGDRGGRLTCGADVEPHCGVGDPGDVLADALVEAGVGGGALWDDELVGAARVDPAHPDATSVLQPDDGRRRPAAELTAEARDGRDVADGARRCFRHERTL